MGKTLNRYRKSISDVTNCMGCAACSIACARQAITIRESHEGFYRPQVGSGCIDCGRCRIVCPALTNPLVADRCQIVAAQAKDEKVLECASSGGGIPVLAQMFAAQGYKLCGVRYNPQTECAEHFIASSFDEFQSASGSKYLQSYTTEAFRKVILDEGKYFVVGTPCQITGLRKVAELNHRANDIFFVDFWCHGVPSHKLWRAFLRSLCVTDAHAHAKWRDKDRFGWYNGYCVTLEKDGRCLYGKSYLKGERFTRHFIRSSCTNKSCLECPFDANHSAADVRFGDCWDERFSSSRGVSKVALLTQRGEMAWQQVKSEVLTFDLTERQKDSVLALQCGNRYAPRGIERSAFLWCLDRWNGFYLAHAWHLAWVIGRRLKGLFGNGR